jgi:predicted enzyme related to lactoylglutathione lyase
MAKVQGMPCWYELSTSKGNLDAACRFYDEVLGWKAEDSGMPDFDYRLARSDGDLVAGLMVMPEDVSQMPPMWMIYFAAEDGEKTVADIRAGGGTIHRDLAVIPGTGRFAIAGDPQGAGFGILEPEPMEEGPPAGRAFDQAKAGHGNWHELMTSDPEAGFGFYSGVFGWQKSRAMDMGEEGTYQLFSHDGGDIGGIMRQGSSPYPSWLPYFGVNGVDEAIARIEKGGGTILHGPMEVPGGAFIVVAQDPQGAFFAAVGPKTYTA